jgi:hypothetical protein
MHLTASGVAVKLVEYAPSCTYVFDGGYTCGGKCSQAELVVNSELSEAGNPTRECVSSCTGWAEDLQHLQD